MIPDYCQIERNMKLIAEQTILITGATDGLGKMIAHYFANQGATILIHGRNREKGDLLLKELKDYSKNDNLFYYNADFSSLDEVKALAHDIIKHHSLLDLLINNAGIGGNKTNQREFSKDGYELRFAVNYLAPFLLTHLLLPLLRNAVPSKIVNIGSAAQEEIDFADVMLEKNYAGLRAYSQSKLANLMFTLSLAEQLKADKITVNCVHPASLMDTKMVRNYFGYSKSTVEEGAESVEYVASSKDIDGVTGVFFNRKVQDKGHPQAYDKEARKKLYDLSVTLTRLNS